MDDLISREAAIAEIEEYIEEYSELEPETGYHNLKWCAMEEAKDVLSMLPTVDAIPLDWLREKMRGYASALKSTETEALVRVMQMWRKEQEAR